eukprot:1898067-Prymnesium_polylepis.1
MCEHVGGVVATLPPPAAGGAGRGDACICWVWLFGHGPKGAQETERRFDAAPVAACPPDLRGCALEP